MKRELALVPVWASLPALPIHFFDKHSLFSTLSPVGKPLFLDSVTAMGTRPSVARVCVEMDLLKPICSRVWVAVEGEAGFWQNIILENLPKYCCSCWRLGHSVEDCKKGVVAEVGAVSKGNQARHAPQREGPLIVPEEVGEGTRHPGSSKLAAVGPSHSAMFPPPGGRGV